MQSPHRMSEGGHNSEVETNSQLIEIEKVLDELKCRREILEEQRRRLLGSGNKLPKNSNNLLNYTSSQGLTEATGKTTSRSQSHLAKVHSVYHNKQHNASVISHSLYIPSEAERRRSKKHDVFGEMKESIRRSWERDSTLLMGTFLLEDNPRASTFGRERRFIPLVGQKGPYYLSTDTELLSKTKNEQLNHLTASSRGKRGANISNHWNDMQCSGPPGPGAYTPRYSKMSKPSARTRI